MSKQIGRRNAMNAQRRLMQGARSAEGDKMAYAYYDTLALDPTIAEYNYFLAGIGASYNGINKTKAQTNLPSNGMVPAGHRMRVHDIHLEYWTCEDKPAALWIQRLYHWSWNAWMEVSIAGKDAILVLPVSEMFGTTFYTSIVPAATFNTVFSNGQFKGIYPLNIPIVLPALQTFKFTIYCGTLPYATTGGNGNPVLGQKDDQVRIIANGMLERMG